MNTTEQYCEEIPVLTWNEGLGLDVFSGERPLLDDRDHQEATIAQEEQIPLVPYTLTAQMKDFIPMPREVLQMGMSASSILLYGLLLDRATLSQRSGWCSYNGWVYIHYTIKKLSEKMKMSESSIRRMLMQLEDAQLILRLHFCSSPATFIFLRIPEASIDQPSPL